MIDISPPDFLKHKPSIEQFKSHLNQLSWGQFFLKQNHLEFDSAIQNLFNSDFQMISLVQFNSTEEDYKQTLALINGISNGCGASK